jgi:hypothetical protein
MAQALTEGLNGVRGIIFDSGRVKIQQELRGEAARRKVETVLDPRVMDLASPNGESRSELVNLGWAAAGRKQPDELRSQAGKETARELARFVVDHGFSAILAPTHYLTDGESPWLRSDSFVTQAVRAQLDELGATGTPIYYPLALPSTGFRDVSTRREIISALRDLPIDSVWLRVHPFGTTASGPIVLRSYIEACQDLHQLGIPLVAERSGTIVIALLAFGAVGGIESGVTTGENFDFGRLTRPPKRGRAFLAHPRVYLKDLGIFLPAKAARFFFDLRGTKTFFGCRETCCPKGIQDMLGNPRRHFIVTRAHEVGRVSSVPVNLRRQIYMEEFLRPPTDLALQAAQLYPDLEKQRRRLESWRRTLGAVARENPLKTWSQAPDGRRVRARSKVSA